MNKKKRSASKRYVWRDADTGRLAGVAVADPAVRPTTVTVDKIRRAVREVAAARSDRAVDTSFRGKRSA
jgi:hypothetical protein